MFYFVERDPAWPLGLRVDRCTDNVVALSTIVGFTLTLTARGSTSESDVCRRQILTSNVDLRAERVGLKYLYGRRLYI